MVDQANMNGKGAASSPARGLVTNFYEFASDILTLVELQTKLFAEDARLGRKRFVAPAILLFCGAGLILSCLPIALVTIALLLMELAAWSPAQAFLATVGIGLLTGILLASGAAYFLRNSLGVFQRSLNECDANVRWVKNALRRFGRRTNEPGTPHSASRSAC